MKRNLLMLIVGFVLGASGIATAGVMAGTGSPSSSPHGKAEANEGAGVHGGPIDRFHGAGACDLTTISSLPGNWTHGDYVSAVAANGTSAQVRMAAWSDCGKPMVAAGHGGPPQHALDHVGSGRAHTDDAASEAPGS